jgi:hypothetical protein
MAAHVINDLSGNLVGKGYASLFKEAEAYI